MAKVTNAFDKYSAQADREALSNVIYNINAQQTQLRSSIGKKNRKKEVQQLQICTFQTDVKSQQDMQQ